jgi:multiple sugar transport system ATP-binding protein
MRVELKRLHERLQTTMIYVTHDQVEAMTMGDRICVMQDGDVQQVAPPLELYHNPVNKFVAGFIGNPPMNFVDVRVEPWQDGVVLKSDAFAIVPAKDVAETARPYIGREVTLGVRPEDLYDRLFYTYDVSEGQTFKAVVDVVEPMGSEIYLHMIVAKTDLVVRVPAYVHAEPHQPMELVVNLNRLHLFDKDTERSILSGRSHKSLVPTQPPSPLPAASLSTPAS